MMQFALWPLESLNKHYLRHKGWQLTATDKHRLLQTLAGDFLSVEFVSAKELIIENHLRNYQVRIQTLEKMEL